ncbi:DUF4320 family protein [Clostridioides difficile]|nr:DUF4320 family protein [Clostridioides difficile]
MKNVLKNNHGFWDLALGTPIILFIIFLIIAFAINALPVFTTKYQLDQFSSSLMREVELTGEINENIDKRVQTLKEQTGVEPDEIKWDTTYINGTHKIQINEEIKLTLKKTVDIGFFEFGSIPIDIPSKATGRSEQYWK